MYSLIAHLLKQFEPQAFTRMWLQIFPVESVATNIDCLVMWLQMFPLQKCGCKYSLCKIVATHTDSAKMWHKYSLFPVILDISRAQLQLQMLYFTVQDSIQLQIPRARSLLQIFPVQDCSYKYFPCKTVAKDISHGRLKLQIFSDPRL